MIHSCKGPGVNVIAKIAYLLSRYAADAAFLPLGMSGRELLNRPHLLDTVDTVPTVLKPWALSISPPIITATSEIQSM